MCFGAASPSTTSWAGFSRSIPASDRWSSPYDDRRVHVPGSMRPSRQAPEPHCVVSAACGALLYPTAGCGSARSACRSRSTSDPRYGKPANAIGQSRVGPTRRRRNSPSPTGSRSAHGVPGAARVLAHPLRRRTHGPGDRSNFAGRLRRQRSPGRWPDSSQGRSSSARQMSSISTMPTRPVSSTTGRWRKCPAIIELAASRMVVVD